MLTGFRLLWANLMSYRKRHLIVYDGNTIIGHYYFAVGEKLAIPELGILLREPQPLDPTKELNNQVVQIYLDGHDEVIHYDRKADMAMVLANKKKVDDLKAQMLKEMPGIKNYIARQQKIFKTIFPNRDEKDFLSALDPMYWHIPMIDPRKNWIKWNDHSMGELAATTKEPKEGMVSKLLSNPLALALIVLGGIAVIIIAPRIF